MAGYYGYDANGERVYKLTGSTEMDTPEPSGTHDRMNPRTGNFEKAGTWGDDMGVKNITIRNYGHAVVFKIYLPSVGKYISY